MVPTKAREGGRQIARGHWDGGHTGDGRGSILESPHRIEQGMMTRCCVMLQKSTQLGR